jgi:WS/DGAT/MGAT family acyltransferase
MAESSFELLSPLDAQLWYWDTPATPMNMGNLCLFEGGPLFDDSGAFRLDDVRRAIASRLHLVPRYRRKVIGIPFHHPILIDDPEFDIVNHVELIRLPEPGTEQQLKAAFARVHEGMLDTSRPPWKMVFVEGLEDGRVGLIQKIHHSPFDGATTVKIISSLCDTELEPKKVEPPQWHPQPPPHILAVGAATLRGQVRSAWKLLRGPHGPSLNPARARELAETLAALRHFMPARRTSLNRRVSPHRRFDWIPTTLPEIKQIRGLVMGSTLNDVILAAVAGGLRDLFVARDEDVTTIRPRVFVPVDARDANESGDAAGNQISAMVLALPIDEPSPVKRLLMITQEMVALKAGRQAPSMRLIMDLSNFMPPVLLSTTAQAMTRRSFMNLTVTNVPGPRHELYLLGAKMLELNPMLPIGNLLTVNIAVESYVDKLSIAFCCDPEAVPDLDELIQGTARALKELLAAAQGKPEPLTAKA